MESSQEKQGNTEMHDTSLPSRAFGDSRSVTLNGNEPLLSKAYTQAITRGKTILEKKSTWAFDYYQAGGFYPVDYTYWWTPYKSQIGKTQLTMMHAAAYADGQPFAADQMQRRSSLRISDKLAKRGLY